MFVERTGYQEIDKHRHRVEGRALTLVAGQDLTDLVIRLQAAAVIEGRVTDEDGDPMPEAQVAVLRQSFLAGRSHWEQAGAERTNDLGEYRIAGLSAGSYFVSVTPPPDFRSLIETAVNVTTSAPHNEGTEKPAPAAYQTTYYPGTHDRGQAGMIQLHAGEDFPVNFSLAPSPSLTIRGSVVNLPPGSTAAITLQSDDFNLTLNGAEMRKDGTFEIRDVSPGAYTILATVDNVPVPMMARQALQVTSTNVEGLRLAPKAGGSIRGRVRMEAKNNDRPDPSQMFLFLRAAGGEEASGVSIMEQSFSSVIHVNADGTFDSKNVAAGSYTIQISDASAMPDWFLKTVTANGRDVRESAFSISGSTTTLDLVASANGGLVEGFATTEKDEPDSDAVVVAVPEARFHGRPDFYRKAVSDQSGHFALRGLPPGDYTIFAWESVDGEAYYNPEFLQKYEGQGTAIHVKEGEHVGVKIKAISVAQDE